VTGSVAVADPRFAALIDPASTPRRLATGCEWAEGPVWLPAQVALVWSDIPNDRMLRWSEQGGVTVFRQPSGKANGNTLDREGRLVTCEHLSHRVSRTEPDGTVVGLVERYQGRRLNSPNDLVVKSDGSIWFTDPPYGILTEREGRPRPSEIGANYVYRLDPERGAITVLAQDFDRPNGIAFSPDERLVYISDSGSPRHIRVFEVEGAALGRDCIFAVLNRGVSDGFRVDVLGNVWTSAGDGVHVLSPEGTLLGKILLPEKASNCEFGGTGRSTLFITASTSLYAIEVLTVGARRPG
jgi:gluconolactonase